MVWGSRRGEIWHVLVAEPALVLLSVFSSPPAASGCVGSWRCPWPPGLAGSPVLSLTMLLKTPVACFPFWVCSVGFFCLFFKGGGGGVVFSSWGVEDFFFVVTKEKKDFFHAIST